ncbi:MAG: hypothetical protein K8T90_12990 [Planctomycetes bacterium]|nr:hypothetical protein [Planctomycetota bacterium]
MTRRGAREVAVRPAWVPVWVLAVIFAVAGCSDPASSEADHPRSAPHANADAPAAVRNDVLDRIVRAETTLAYHGLRSIVQGPRGASRETRLRVAHAADGRTLIEWEGQGAASRRRWAAESRFPWVKTPDLLLANYDVALDPEPSAPVAWRETRRVTISGRHAARPSMELLVDAETWIVLTEVTRDASGNECRSARFETFELGPLPQADATTRARADDPAVEALATDAPTPSERPDGLRPLAVRDLPLGFRQIGAGMSACGAWRDDFSDGLATLSVLQRVATAVRDTTPSASGRSEAPEIRRRVWLGGSQLQTTIGGIEVTVAASLGAEDVLGVVRGLREPGPDR